MEKEDCKHMLQNLSDDDFDVLWEDFFSKHKYVNLNAMKARRNKVNAIALTDSKFHPSNSNTQSLISIYDSDVNEQFGYHATDQYVEDCAEIVLNGGLLHNYHITKDDEERKICIKLNHFVSKSDTAEMKTKLDNFIREKYDKIQSSRIVRRYNENYLMSDNFGVKSYNDETNFIDEYAAYIGAKLTQNINLSCDNKPKDFILDKCVMHNDNNDPNFKKWKEDPISRSDLAKKLIMQIENTMRKKLPGKDDATYIFNITIKNEGIIAGNINNSKINFHKKDKSNKELIKEYVNYIIESKPEWYDTEKWIDFKNIKENFVKIIGKNPDSRTFSRILGSYIREDTKTKYEGRIKKTYWKLKKISDVEI